MKAKIEIKMDNSAFDGDPSVELGRILSELSDHFEDSGMYNKILFDINGNRVGFFRVK